MSEADKRSENKEIIRQKPKFFDEVFEKIPGVKEGDIVLEQILYKTLGKECATYCKRI